MTKLEFIDKINDILIGLNTAESDALGSLYDELMRDNNWQHYRIKAAIAAMQGMLANPEHHKTQVESGVPCSYFYAVNAVMCADDLIAELQKKGGQDGQ